MLEQNFKLNNSIYIPKVGLGTWQTPDGDTCFNAVMYALEYGYRHIDTAVAYGNEKSVGQAVRKSGINRNEIFVTTKVPAEIKSYKEAVECIEKSLDTLDLGYSDLMLIHAPKPWSEMFDPNVAKTYYEENVEVYEALTEYYEKGLLKSIGVSNFDVDDIKNITSHCKIKPMVNQIRYCIGYTQNEITEYCKNNDILVEGYSPLATGKILDNEQLKKMASDLGVTLPQLCIKYLLEKDVLPLPKSTHKEYIISNAQLNFEIGDKNIKILDSLKNLA